MRYVLLAAGLALHAPVGAMENDSGGSAAPITEAEFLAAALADPVTGSTLSDIGAEEEARRRAASLPPNPGVEAERESPGDARQTTAVVSWRPPLDGRRGPEIAAADAALAAANHRRAVAEADLRIELRSTYAAWAVGEERVRLLETQRRRLEELARQAEERAARGEESGLNARRFRFAAAELAAEHARARAEAVTARAAASAFAGDVADRQPLLPDLPESAPPDTLESPALAALRAERRQAEHERRRAGRFLAFPEIFAGWQWQDAPGADADGPVLGIAWDLPLFDRDQAEHGRASRRVVATRAREEMAARRLAAERASRTAAYDTLEAAAHAAWGATESAETTIDAAAAAYRHGETSMTDFLDTIRSILAGRLAALDLHAAALAAHRELERAAGRPLPR